MADREAALLIAHSYGGNVALNIALRGRVPLSQMILLEPVAKKTLLVADDPAAFEAAKKYL